VAESETGSIVASLDRHCTTGAAVAQERSQSENRRVASLMPTNLATSARPTRAQLLSSLRNHDLSVEALVDFCALPPECLRRLKDLAVPEDWGDEETVLQRYLALHLPLAIGQGKYVWSGSQIAMRAGHLATPEGAALYVGLAKTDGERWELSWADERPSLIEALSPADVGPWPEFDPRLEVVVTVDPIRSGALAGLGLVAQRAAVAGAVEWSARRGLAVRQFRGESRGYFVPVHLTSRVAAPDLVAPVQVQSGRLVVRALIELCEAYPTARAVVERRDQLPAWMLDGWAVSAAS
jgi:hypothetical protein